MGCCVSSNRASPSSPKSSTCQEIALGSRAPSPVEEETVKEVLSETHKWNPTITQLQTEKPPQNLAFDKFEGETKVDKTLHVNKPEEISEVSEVCSVSETMSTTTTTITDQREEGEEIRQMINRSPAKMQKNRSFSGDFGGRRERTASKYPARPGPRNVGSARLFQSRDQMSRTRGNGRTRNLPHRQGPGENYVRRSRSPATRTENGAARSLVGLSPSARRTNRSPARVRTDQPESGRRKLENPSMEGKWPSANETLEKPLVSLECFIFL